MKGGSIPKLTTRGIRLRWIRFRRIDGKGPKGRYVDVARQPVFDVIDHGTKVVIQSECVFLLYVCNVRCDGV